VLLQFLALQQNALAQVAGGTLSRTVTDANGNVIPNAEITITNVETGIGRNAITNEVGIYITRISSQSVTTSSSRRLGSKHKEGQALL